MSPDFDGKGFAIIFGSLAIGIFLAAPPLWIGEAIDTHHDALDGGCQFPAWPNDPCGRPEWCWRQGLACPPSDAGPCDDGPCDAFADGGCVCLDGGHFYRSCMAAHGSYDPEECEPFRAKP